MHILVDNFKQNYKVHTCIISMEFSAAVNRRRPAHETPLRPGAKKDGCFCRLLNQLLVQFVKKLTFNRCSEATIFISVMINNNYWWRSWNSQMIRSLAALARFTANSLLKVDRPPLVDPHSLQMNITLIQCDIFTNRTLRSSHPFKSNEILCHLRQLFHTDWSYRFNPKVPYQTFIELVAVVNHLKQLLVQKYRITILLPRLVWLPDSQENFNTTGAASSK